MKKIILQTIIFLTSSLILSACNDEKIVENNTGKTYAFLNYNDIPFNKDYALNIDSNGTLKKYNTKKTTDILESHYDETNNSYILRPRATCVLTVLFKDGKSKEKDICKLKDNYNGSITTVAYNENYYFTIITYGFSKTSSEYLSTIRVTTKDFEFVDDIVVNRIVLEIQGAKDGFYYIKNGSDFQVKDTGDVKEKIMKYDLNTKKEYEIKIEDIEDHVVQSLVIRDNDIIILHTDLEEKKLKLSSFRNNKIKTIWSTTDPKFSSAGISQQAHTKDNSQLLVLSSVKDNFFKITNDNRVLSKMNVAESSISSLNNDELFIHGYENNYLNKFSFKNDKVVMDKVEIKYPDIRKMEYGNNILFFR